MANIYAIGQEAADIGGISLSTLGVAANSFVRKYELVATGKYTSSSLTSYANNEYVKLSDISLGNIPVTGIRLNKTSLSLNEGGADYLIATLIPSNASNQNTRWDVSTPGVISLSLGGNDKQVHATRQGSTNVVVTTDDGGYTATCNVTVIHIPIPVTVKAILNTDVRDKGTIQVDGSTPVNTEFSTVVEEGDSVMFKCNVTSSIAIFDGWYRGSSLINSSATFTMAISSDTTLTARIKYFNVVAEDMAFESEGGSKNSSVISNTNWVVK